MIIFDLECDEKHNFEGWFKNTEEFNRQLNDGLLTCPVCNSKHIHKIPSATNFIHSKPKKLVVEPAPEKQALSDSQSMAKAHADFAVLKKLTEFVEKNFDDVGEKFTDEAKRIHYGEAESRNIRGTASPEEVIELKEEGITALPLPTVVDKKKLN